MASPQHPGLLGLLLVAFLAAAARVPSASAAEEYCRDSLRGLLACNGFMYEGAPGASPECCAAYGAAFDADPFCLCYIANGVYGRSTGYDVNVDRALEIPASCGQVSPPIELCGMQGLVLPPYEPELSPAAVPPPPPRPAQEAPEASSPAAQPPSAGSVEPSPSPAAPSFTSPPPPPTSGVRRDSSVQMALFFAVAVGLAASVA